MFEFKQKSSNIIYRFRVLTEMFGRAYRTVHTSKPSARASFNGQSFISGILIYPAYIGFQSAMTFGGFTIGHVILIIICLYLIQMNSVNNEHSNADTTLPFVQTFPQMRNASSFEPLLVITNNAFLLYYYCEIIILTDYNNDILL